MKSHHTSALLTLVAIIAVGLSAILPASMQARSDRNAPRKERWADHADERKADYIFMEAMRQHSLSSNADDVFELLRHMQQLQDPRGTQPGFMLGYYYLALMQQDTVFGPKGLDLMRAYFNNDPSDYYNAIFYGMVNTELGDNNEALRVWSRLDSLFPTKPDIALRHAQALQQKGDSAGLRNSIDILNRIQRAEGRSLGLYSNKITSLMALRDTVGVLAEVDSLMASSAGNATNTVYAGDVMMALGRSDSAITFYDRACVIDPTHGLSYYKRAQYYRERGDSAAFDREVVQAVRQDGLDTDVKLEIMRTYVIQLMQDSLQRPRIESLFDTLLVQHPHEAKIHDMYSSYLAAIEDFHRAAEQQEYVLDDDPSQQGRWLSTISLYNRADDNAKALATAERALHYLPDDPMILFYAGNSLGMLDRFDEAIAKLRTALEHTPDDNPELQSAIYSNIGDFYWKLSDADSAIVYYDHAISVNPQNILALNNYAYFLAEQNRDLDRAESMSSIAVRQQPDNDTFIDTFAWILFRRGRYAEAKEQIDRALVLETDEPQADVLHHAGDIYYMTGDHQQALKLWEEALQLEPDNKLLQKKVKHKTHFYE